MNSNKDSMMRRSQKKGLPPGSLVHIGSRFPGQEGMTLHHFNSEIWTREKIKAGTKPDLTPSKSKTTWLEIDGLSDNTLLDPVFNLLPVNSLVLEDILNTDQNAKFDTGDKWMFVVFKNIKWNPKALSWKSEQISLLLQPDVLVSFTEKKSDLFQPVFARMENPESKTRSHGADFTFYSLMDVLIDEYLEICENLEIQTEELELSMEGRTDVDPTQTVHQIRKFQIFFRHQVIPVREGVTRLIKEHDHLISEDDLPYFHDIQDHLDQVISKLDEIRDNLASLREMYLTQINTGMNKVIKLLTVVSTIFIPVTFVAGIYGMNFTNMPELHWKYGYFIILGVMLLLGLGSYLLFRRKKWM